MTVLVLLGGDSPEREVSLRSGKAIANALRRSNIGVIEYDPIHGNEELLKLVSQSDIVLPVLHGKNGEDGKIQELLESVNAQFLGSNSTVSRVCFDKVETHKILEAEGILMPKYELVTKEDTGHAIFSKPFVLKPKDGGSSLDTLVAREVSLDVIGKAKHLLSKYDSMIVEELIDGPEITVAVLGSEVLPVIAIIPPEDSEFDYNNKYNGKSKEICPVPDEIIPTKLQKEAEELALQVHILLNARHLSRTDMMIDKNGRIYVLELNTMPGMTNQSLFPIAANAVGLDMEKLVQEFIKIINGEQK
jgi:D-alanine-D-alanine ligase